MPALAGLAPLIVALMAALLSIACTLIVRAIASQMPNLSILGVGLNVAKWFRDAADGIVNWCVDEFNKYFDDLADWFTGHILVHLQFFGAVVSAVNHLGDQIAHIVDDAIPNAIRAAEADAGRVAHDLFNTAERDVAVAENRIDTLVTHTIPNAISSAEHYADGAISDVHRIIRQEIADAKAAVESDLQTAKTDLTRSISNLAETVANDFTQAKAIAQADATAALNTARGLIDQAKTEAENVAQADADRVTGLLHAAVDTLNTTIGNLTTTVGRDLTAAEAYAQQQVADGVQTVTDQLTATANRLQSAITAGAAAAAAGIATDLQAAQQDATQALGSAEGAIGGALGDIYTDLTGKSLAYNGDLTQVAGAVGLAITGAIAGVVTRVAKLEKCSVGVCDDSPNNFSNLLKDALGLGELVGVGAFLTKAIDAPASIVSEVSGDIVAWRSEGQKALDLLLNL